MEDCIFCKIANHEVPKEFEYEDKNIMVFADLYPVRPVHLLIVSKKHIGDFLEVKDYALFHKLFNMVQKMIKKKKLENKGYRVLINGGGAQIINHLHIHLIGPLGKVVKI